MKELWFARGTSGDSLPKRPAKLTPIFSKKRAEIANFDEPPFDDEIRRRPKKKRSSVSDLGLTEPPIKESSMVKEIPSNPIDFIWDTDNMLPKRDADLNDHSKMALGGTVAKLDENDRITTIGLKTFTCWYIFFLILVKLIQYYLKNLDDLMKTSLNEFSKTGQKKEVMPPKEDLMLTKTTSSSKKKSRSGTQKINTGNNNDELNSSMKKASSSTAKRKNKVSSESMANNNQMLSSNRQALDEQSILDMSHNRVTPIQQLTEVEVFNNNESNA